MAKKENCSGIVFLQETHSVPENESKWKQDLGNPNILFSHGPLSGRGVCTILPGNSDFRIIDGTSDDNGRFLLTHLTVSDTELVLVNVYMPTKDKRREELEFLSYVNYHLSGFKDKKIVLGGDLNTCLHVSTHLLRIMNTFDLFDVYRFQNSEGRMCTWRNRAKSGLVQYRLDMFFI